MKSKPCCARLDTLLIQEQSHLQHLARRASYLTAKGRSTVAVQADIAKARTAISEAKANIDSHAADHAGEREHECRQSCFELRA